MPEAIHGTAATGLLRLSPEKLHRVVRSIDVEAVDACGFPAEVFAALLERYLEEGPPSEGTPLTDQFDDVGPDGVAGLAMGADAAADLEAARAGFAAGEYAVVLLCGGMATRFGGGIKALAEVLPGRRFIDVALDEIRELGAAFGAPVPTIVVTGVATHLPVGRYLAERWPEAAAGGWLRTVRQRVFPRVLATGAIPMPVTDFPVFYPPGHGDVLTSLAEKDVAAWLRTLGVRRVFTWGIDNLLAGPDVRIAGAHLRAGRPVTVEVVRRRPGERGGSILRRNGRIESVEGARPGTDMAGSGSTLLNTNSMVIETEVLADPPELPFRVVEKEVAGNVVIQFERLLGELTHRVDCNLLLVPRDGTESRFAPIKKPEDLPIRSPALPRPASVREERVEA